MTTSSCKCASCSEPTNYSTHNSGPWVSSVEESSAKDLKKTSRSKQCKRPAPHQMREAVSTKSKCLEVKIAMKNCSTVNKTVRLRLKLVFKGLEMKRSSPPFYPCSSKDIDGLSFPPAWSERERTRTRRRPRNHVPLGVLSAAG